MASDYLKRLDVQGHLRVKDALRKWDPIGVYSIGADWPDDEYDAYSGPVVSLLDSGASRDAIVSYLERICVHHIGVGFDGARTEVVVDELLQFWPSWKQKVRELGPNHIDEEEA